VYLDSAALDVYQTRLEREEGATLIRVRWYGDGCGGDSSGDAELFVERKTHHESWTTDNSVKERFRLKGRHVAALLRGELDVEAQLAKLRAGGASDADVARTRALATEVAAEVAARRLAPALRTVYFRTAFQLASSNAVRVSLDTQLRMVDERNAPRPAGAWCRRLDAGTQLPARECCDFPFAVLEVKLQDAAPDWVESLLASGRLTACYKFCACPRYGYRSLLAC
jgi:SPX domain protein involved in polyphosphate accumulation